MGFKKKGINDNISKTIIVTNEDLSGTGSLEEQIVEYVNSLNYNKTADSDVFIEYISVGTIQGFVFQDLTEDGVSTGDPGIQDANVHLMDVDENILESTTTDISGNYIFNTVPVGDYIIQINKPGFTATTLNVGLNDSIDSDVNINSAVFTLREGDTVILDGGLVADGGE